MPDKPKATGAPKEGRELLVERKIYGAMQRVTVIDPETGQEASASGPLGRSVEQGLLELAIKKLRRGVST